MASEPNTGLDDTPGPSSDQLTVNLQIVSPSVGVSRPLLFPGLVATTTVKQLKEKIRQSLPLRPADENQRLIHRGRAIVRETDTLLDIFGADTLRTPDQQTIHLVIRDTQEHATVPQPAARGPSPTTTQQPNPPRQHVNHQPFGPQPPPGFVRRSQAVPTSNPFPQPRMPSPSPVHTPEQAAAFQQHHQNMTQWLNQIQREAMARAIVNQNQRARAQMGMRGISDPTSVPAHNGDNSGRASPAPGHAVYREHVGPNGHTYQVETVIRTTAPNTPNGGMSPAEVQGIIRGADNQAALAMTSAMQRSASSTSLHNRSIAQPGVATTVFPMTASGRATPDPAAARAGANGTATRQGPEVYILSSPEGPRALLFNGTGSETYYTPRLRTQTSFPQIRQPYPSVLGIVFQDPQAQVRNRHHHHHHHHHHRPHTHQQQPQAQQQQSQPGQQQQPQAQPQPQSQGELHQRHHHHHQPQNPPQPANEQIQLPDQNQPVIGMHHGNPPVAALPPLLMQLWPHIWLVFRLALFVWFFTNPNTSWSRWFTVICIAFFIFILSTGVLNGIPDHIWRPLGRHLENLIPMEQPRQAAGQMQNDAPGENQDPNPADMAARLVAERHGGEGWLMMQLRRLERAGLLFLASIAPGVAERHIANLEAAARAERERREAEVAAAAAAAAAAAENDNEDNQEGAGDEVEQRNEQQQSQPDTLAQNHGGEEPAREQLIAV